MKAVNLTIALIVAQASWAAWAGPDKLEIKGLQIGMSEAEFKKVNPKAKCSFSVRDKAWDSSISPVRTCSVPSFTVAAKEAKDTRFLFYEDKLGALNIGFHDFYGKDVQQALSDKYGSPATESGKYPGVSWRFADSRMRFHFLGSSAVLFVESPLQDAWDLKLTEFERRNAKKDL
ncbi:hypothetical protein [Acidovorax sp.]|uniref:hypothetical protein n=1 Tax=Acidovorax sp. TaxID=1872122 RepID=UPI002ACE0044|nr:hypothetical protein [Acidovorax sp.]MDZ7862654.1 hypothetical protein [Acidovorax sp.]